MSMRSLAYWGLVQPCLEYASVVWSPHVHTALDVNKIEAVQKTAPAARWIFAEWNYSNFSWNKFYDDCLHEVNWPSLASCPHYYIIDYLHNMLHKRNYLLFDDYFKINSSATLSHPLCI